MPKIKDNNKVPKTMLAHYKAIVEISDEFCSQYLNEEYLQLSRKLAATLARKRPSPLISGNINSWAAGILYALGSINFLSDSSQDPHMSLSELCEKFGVSSSTGAAKSKKIKQMIKMSHWNHSWMIPSKIKDSPLIWILSINGLMVDIRNCPLELQEVAYKKGLIPFIPSDKK